MPHRVAGRVDPPVPWPKGVPLRALQGVSLGFVGTKKVINLLFTTSGCLEFMRSLNSEEQHAKMPLNSAAPSIVRSVLQRDMLNTWLRLFGRNNRLPAIEEFHFDRIENERPDLVYFEIVYGSGEPRFKVMYEGRRLAEAFGTSGEGKYLEDVLGPKLVPITMPIYYCCLSRGRPIYSVFTTSDVRSRIVSYERLLLPFGIGTHVDAIIASIKTISEDGSFEQKGLMRDADAKLAYSVQAVIDAGIDVSGIANQLEADVIEI